jgi:hypothetical protein
MGSGDWNDGMNLVGHGGTGESVWLGFFLNDALVRFSPLARARGAKAVKIALPRAPTHDNLITAYAAAIAATYGSVSAVTFITAVAYLQREQIPFGGHMIAAMALMESPAIIVGVLLYRLYFVRTAPAGISVCDISRPGVESIPRTTPDGSVRVGCS